MPICSFSTPTCKLLVLNDLASSDTAGLRLGRWPGWAVQAVKQNGKSMSWTAFTVRSRLLEPESKSCEQGEFLRVVSGGAAQVGSVAPLFLPADAGKRSEFPAEFVAQA